MEYYDYDVSSAAAGGVFGAIMAFIGVILIICAIVAVLQIVGVWKILKKANKPGWGAIIPIYNQYLLCQITGVNPWWILIVCLSPILGIIPVIGSIASAVVSIYFVILLNVSLARSFGKEDGFAVGLILLAPVFNLILGCGKSEYQGAKPMNDVIFKKAQEVVSPTSNNVNSTGTDTNVKYCSSCGSKIDVNTRFCPNCGKETN